MIAELFLACALALPSQGGWRPPLTRADRDFHSFMRQLTNYELGFINKKDSWETLTQKVRNTPPGGIIFIEQEFDKLHNYFKERDFEYFPFMWRGYHIYRRRGGAA